ncbi:MgtC/SapB family protein [bacterium]|nr:MgtC/SapB family protein [bacterium]
MSLGWSWEELLRLLLAIVLGVLVGLERQMLHKPAGVRTIGIVTLGSCLIMMLGIRLHDAYGDVTDPARLAAQVISGIGFLCAGVIIQTRMHVQGLTTAAVVWMMAGVGLAIGAGWYVVGISAALLAWIGLILDPLVTRFVEWRISRRSQPPPDALETDDSSDD